MTIVTYILAYFRLSNAAICKASAGSMDFHDYPDSKDGLGPLHFYTHTCRRCGKEFSI